MKFKILLLLCLLGLVSCASNKFVETDLYFGLSKPDGSIIADKAWDDFVKDYVAKVYATGFTQVSADGKWRDPETKKLAGEPSRIIISVHRRSYTLSVQIDSLRWYYKKIFSQQSVLRVDKKIETISF